MQSSEFKFTDFAFSAGFQYLTHSPFFLSPKYDRMWITKRNPQKHTWIPTAPLTDRNPTRAEKRVSSPTWALLQPCLTTYLVDLERDAQIPFGLAESLQTHFAIWTPAEPGLPCPPHSGAACLPPQWGRCLHQLGTVLGSQLPCPRRAACLHCCQREKTLQAGSSRFFLWRISLWTWDPQPGKST